MLPAVSMIGIAVLKVSVSYCGEEVIEIPFGSFHHDLS